MEGSCDNITPSPSLRQKGDSLNCKPLKRTLKECDGDAEVWLSTANGFWWEVGGEGPSSEGWASGSLTMIHKLDLFSILSYLGRGRN